MLSKQKYLRFCSVMMLLLAGAFGFRLGAAFYWQSRITTETGLYFGDSETYWWLAEAVAQGQPYQFDDWQVFRMPGYPILLAPLFWLYDGTPPVMTARVENALLGTLLVAAVGVFAFQLFQDRKTAFWAACFVAFEPCTVITNIWVLAETPFCLAMIGQLSAFVAAMRTTKKSQLLLYAAWFAVLSTITIYFRPSWFYFGFFVLFVYAVYSVLFNAKKTQSEYKESSNPARILRITPIHRATTILLIFVPVFVLCMSPWWVRNFRVTGRFVSTTLQMGPSLYDGLSPMATGASDMRFTEEFRRLEREQPRFETTDTYEYRVNERIKKAAIDWAKQNPGRVVELVVIKFFRIWNIWPNEPAFASSMVRVVVFLTYTPILLAGLFGFYKTWRKGYDYAILLLPAFYLTILHMVFVASLRYRIPAMLCLMILAAHVFCVFSPKIRQMYERASTRSGLNL